MGTSPIALVRSIVLAPLVEFLERERLPYEDLFEDIRLSPQVAHRPDELILLGQAFALGEKIEQRTGIENIGLLAANTIKLDSFARLRDIAGEGETLFEALDRLTWRIAAFNTGERLSLEWQGERLFFSHKFALRPFPRTRHGDAYSLVVMMKVVQLALGPDWKPDLIVLPEHEGIRKRQYEAFFKTNISFKGDAWAISIPPSRLADPLPKAIPAATAGTQDPEKTLPSPCSADIMTSLRAMIRPSLRLAYPDIGYGAGLAGVSVSTFKRRLGEAGLTYTELIETERLRLSMELLAQDGVKVSDIASELGYTEPGNFIRAFRKWTGLTPSKFRAAQASAPLLSG